MTKANQSHGNETKSDTFLMRYVQIMPHVIMDVLRLVLVALFSKSKLPMHL